MLVWTSGKWITYDDILVLDCRAHTVWNDTLIGKITTANDISRSGRRDRNLAIAKKAVFIAVCHKPVSYTHLDVYKRQLLPDGLGSTNTFA